MYLVELDQNTSLVKEDFLNDSWKGIKVFNNLVEKMSIKALTVVALSVDYQSIYSHYKEKDRPIRVMEEVYGTRDAIDYNCELMQLAISKYKELQFNPDLEQKRIFNDRHISLLEKINAANQDDDDILIDKLTKQLSNHQDTIDKFKKNFDKEKSMEGSVASTGYVLSRIESDIKSRKNSKFKDKEFSNNPNKLKLQDE